MKCANVMDEELLSTDIPVPLATDRVATHLHTPESHERMVTDLVVFCKREQLSQKSRGLHLMERRVLNPTQERDWENTVKPLFLTSFFFFWS